MTRVGWFLVLVGLWGTGCLDWENDIPCRADRHCPSGNYCDNGHCVSGEREPDAGVRLPSDAGIGGQG